MNKTILLWIIVYGGIGVLLSYWWVSHQRDAQKLWGGIESKWIWKIGGTLTAIGFLYIAYYLIGTNVVITTSLIVTYVFFYLSAGTWVFVTVMAIRNPTLVNKGVVFLNLMCTAITSGLIMFLLSPELKKDVLLTISLILLCVQHVILDLVVWFIYFV